MVYLVLLRCLRSVLFSIVLAFEAYKGKEHGFADIFRHIDHLFLQLLIACHMKLVPKTDLSHVYDQCVTMLENNSLILSDSSYFGFYLNNIPITILIYWVFRTGNTFGCSDYRLLGGIFNVILLSVTYLSANYMLKCYVSKRTQTLVMFFLLTNPIYYAYASYYYTDTVSLAFMSAGAALFVAGARRRKWINEAVLYVLAGILIMIAMKIRITCSFLPVALAVYYYSCFLWRWRRDYFSFSVPPGEGRNCWWWSSILAVAYCFMYFGCPMPGIPSAFLCF